MVLGHEYKVETLYSGTELGARAQVCKNLQIPAILFENGGRSKGTKVQVTALIDARSDVRVQENVEEITTNKDVYAQVQKLMKNDRKID